MATLHLYSHASGAARLGLYRIPHVFFAIEGPKACLVMTLPTCPLDDLAENAVDGWLETIQGPILTRAEADDDQRVTALYIALTYRAFARRDPNVNLDNYNEFKTMLVCAALILGPNDDAQEEIRDIYDWIEANIPFSVLEARDIPRLHNNESISPPSVWTLVAGGVHARAHSAPSASSVSGPGAPPTTATSTASQDVEEDEVSDGDMPDLLTADEDSD
ncbi:hypothetical protein VTO73DRAFT_15572 [Trametes versicolor]